MVVFKKFDIFNLSEDERNDFHKFRRQSHFEDTPEDPMTEDKASEEGLKAQIVNLDLDAYSYGMYDDNKIIGFLFFGYFKDSSPSYATNEKFVIFDMEMLKKYRRQGIGSKALQIMAEICEKHNKSVFMTTSFIPETRHFFDSIGAKIASQQIENRLKLAEVNWTMIDHWIKEGQSVNPNTSIKTFRGPIPDANVSEFLKSLNETMNLVPKDAIEIGDIQTSLDELRKSEQITESAGITTLTTLTIEQNNEISGLTIIKISPGRETLPSQGLTGVPLKYRGRKLGKWVKASMLKQIKENYPDAVAIVTGNAETNEPMLYINRNLGFKKHKEFVTAQITLDQLKSYLNSKPEQTIEVLN